MACTAAASLAAASRKIGFPDSVLDKSVLPSCCLARASKVKLASRSEEFNTDPRNRHPPRRCKDRGERSEPEARDARLCVSTSGPHPRDDGQGDQNGQRGPQ